MDADEIREIREMEAKVAEQVMGWTNLKSPPPNRPSLSWQGKPPTGTSTDYYVPEYMRLIEKAWRIVERLWGNGVGFEVLRYVPPCHGDFVVRFGNAEDTVRADAATAPEAICQAALRWTERTKT